MKGKNNECNRMVEKWKITYCEKTAKKVPIVSCIKVVHEKSDTTDVQRYTSDL